MGDKVTSFGLIEFQRKSLHAKGAEDGAFSSVLSLNVLFPITLSQRQTWPQVGSFVNWGLFKACV